MEFRVLPGLCYKDEEGNKRVGIRVGDETFKDIRGRKLRTEKCRKCRYYNVCCDTNHIVRMFDCEKNLDTLQKVYNTLTSVVMAFAVSYIFAELQFSFFTKIAIMLLTFVAFDMICTLIEKGFAQIYDWIFYRKLIRIKRRNEKLEEEARKAEEAQRQKEEAEKIANAPNYQKVITAKAIVQKLRELSDNHHYGPNEEKIDVCVEKTEAILEKLQEDSSGYVRVMYLFEAYLPEFCETLELYSNFVKADAVTEEYEKVLTECVDVILKYLEGQRVKAMFDQDSVETKFQASASTLKDMIQEEIK